jgi:hypothetical protein
MGEKTCVVTCTTPSGFVIVESSSCVDPANYDERIGYEICKDRIINKLWELEGYCLQKELTDNAEKPITNLPYGMNE